LSWTTILLNWYAEHKRVFPWRNTRDPYKIWLSEIILQQTRIQQGLPYYKKFIKVFPSVHHLAAATEVDVLKLWQGLGYYSRARNLWATAKTVSHDYSGEFPTDFSSLLRLKGVGDYTASAIASICYDEPQAVVDGNVYRVLSRHFGIYEPINTAPAFSLFKQKAQQLLDINQPGNFNQALMEFGALQCVPKNPNCEICIFQNSCHALKHGKVNDLPLKIPRPKTRKRYFNYLVLVDPYHCFLLQKREMKGIWQHLYEFPLWESSKNLNDLPIKAQKILALEATTPWQLWKDTPVIHKLSHQELHITFWTATVLNPIKRGVSPYQMEAYPVPVVIQNFIHEFFGLST